MLDANGICLPCRNSGQKESEIDWQAREKAFRQVVAAAKTKSSGYDCLIPVSGGKDSTWQVVICKEYGLNPLAVTWKTPARTELGAANLANLIHLGVDHIDYQVNPEVERIFMLRSLKKFGSTAVPMHMAMFNIPLKIAQKFEIPLVVWGENSAFEYGSDTDESTGFRLTNEWLRSHGNTFGTTAADWVDETLTRQKLTAYFGPDPAELQRNSISAVFLGYYFRWDPDTSFAVATKNGFRAREQGPKTGYYNYADIDDDFMSIHHYIKWYKFGCTRLFDNLSLEIRNGRMTRSEALALLAKLGDQRPDDDIEKLCGFLRISRAEFNRILETFRNREIWKQEDGCWKIPGFILPEWRWQ